MENAFAIFLQRVEIPKDVAIPLVLSIGILNLTSSLFLRL
jgi:hypothetical protein